jgi:hypothetical protein
MEQKLTLEQHKQLRDLFTNALLLQGEAFVELAEGRMDNYDAKRDQLQMLRFRFSTYVSSL